MRQRDEDALAADPAVSGQISERHASPEAFDRERSGEEDDAWSDERELLLEPRRAERDLGRRGSTIPRSGRRFARKALRDRRPVWKMRFIDPGLREPAPKLGARASRER